MSLITRPSLLWTDWDLIIIPSLLTIFYLFIFPRISLWVKKKQNNAILSQHSHAINLEITRFKEQKELNKAAFRANPEKEFLAEEIKIDLKKERERVDRRNKIQEYIDEKTKAIKAEADIKSTQAENERVELESKRRQEQTEKRRFDQQTAIHKATMASARFPAVYQLMHIVSQSLHQDGITLSLDGLSNTIAAPFGYDSGKEMMDDEKFNNETLHKIKYLYHDSSFLAKALNQIAKEEESDNEDLSGELLFDHLQSALENYPFEFLSDESLAEKISDAISDKKYEILNSDELSSPMAETNTLFEDIELEVDDFNFDVGFTITLSGYASGYHRKESDMPGQDISVHVISTCVPIIGKFGLSDYQLQISGSPRYYGED